MATRWQSKGRRSGLSGQLIGVGVFHRHKLHAGLRPAAMKASFQGSWRSFAITSPVLASDRRAAGVDVIAPPPLGSSGLAVDGTGLASGYLNRVTEPAHDVRASDRRFGPSGGKRYPGPP